MLYSSALYMKTEECTSLLPEFSAFPAVVVFFLSATGLCWKLTPRMLSRILYDPAFCHAKKLKQFSCCFVEEN